MPSFLRFIKRYKWVECTKCKLSYVYDSSVLQKGGEIMGTSSFEHIVRIQFNALMITVIKCTVKS